VARASVKRRTADGRACGDVRFIVNGFVDKPLAAKIAVIVAAKIAVPQWGCLWYVGTMSSQEQDMEAMIAELEASLANAPSATNSEYPRTDARSH
jgi:hypothetical protein